MQNPVAWIVEQVETIDLLAPPVIGDRSRIVYQLGKVAGVSRAAAAGPLMVAVVSRDPTRFATTV